MCLDFIGVIGERGPGFPGPRPLCAGNGGGAPSAEGAGPREKGLAQNLLPSTLRANKRLSILPPKITNRRLFTADDRQASADCSLSPFGIFSEYTALLPFALMEPGTGNFTSRSLKRKIGFAARIINWNLRRTYEKCIITCR